MSPESLSQIISTYPAGYFPRRLEPAAQTGFSGARIFRIESELGNFCLRGWPVRSLPRERILGLHRFLADIFDAGLKQLAVPIATCTGETLVNHRGRMWQLEPWLPGTADYWHRPSRDRLKNAMATLARFHHLTRNYADPGPARLWFFSQEHVPSPAVAERLSCLRDWQRGKIARLNERLPSVPDAELRELGRELTARFESLAPLIGLQLECLSRVSFRLQVCWRDIWHDHVLFTEDKVTGLVDASAARSENIATDLSRLLGSLVRDDRPAWEFALDEYQTHHPLNADEKALVGALDQSGVLLSGLAWMDRLVLNRETVPHWPRVLDRLKTIAARLETLDGTVRTIPWREKS